MWRQKYKKIYLTSKAYHSLNWSFSEKVDLWSAGGVLYYMIFGEAPFP